jgi:hypothetical protein
VSLTVSLRALHETMCSTTLRSNWLTNTAVSASRLYWENKLALFAPKDVAIPVAVSVFPDEIFAAPWNWAERAVSQARALQQAR